MKTILALILCAASLRAGMAPIAWDAAFPAPASYAVFVRQAGAQEWVWIKSTATPYDRLEGMAAGIWEVQVAAVYGDYLSEPTNTITITVPEFLPAPGNLRLEKRIALQESQDMETWETVATYDVPPADKAFYRIAFTP